VLDRNTSLLSLFDAILSLDFCLLFLVYSRRACPLGDSVWRLHALWAVAHDITGWLTLTPTAEYNHSVAEEHNVPTQRYLELSLPAIFILPYDWSIYTRYKAKIDFESRNHWTHTVDLGVAKRLPKIPLALSAILEKDCDGGNKKFR
jgi:hypothetical protein